MVKLMVAKPLKSSKSDRTRPVVAPHNLPFQMHLLVQQMTRRWQQLLDPYGLTPLHWGILCCLWERDHLATSEIAEQLEQLGGTITVALDAMEKRALIVRSQDMLDRRISRISLTSAARALEAELLPAAAERIEAQFSALSSQEYEQLSHMVARLRQGLRDDR